MMLDEKLRHKAAYRFAMGDVAESPHPTLPRAETHATKISVEHFTAEAETNSTDSPSLPKIAMTTDKLSQHKASRIFALGDVTNAASLPTLPRAETVRPKETTAPLNTRTALTTNAADANADAASTAVLAAKSSVDDDDHDPF